jgi:D-glycero-D-manno-heptose 1,7-bisphosphate phosphatase
MLIDRDGTLCEEVGYLGRVDQVRLLPRAGEAVRRAREAGFRVILATNQSGIARGLIEPSRLDEIHDELQRLLALEDTALDGIYHCPHHPDFGDGECACRKPLPGMLLQAAGEHGLDLAASYMVGDRRRDLAAGSRAGATPVLVLTGYGKREFGYHASDDAERPAFVASDLSAAVEWILKHETPTSESR